MNDVVVIGGGAAGCMAALAAAEKGASVTLLERNPKLGRKLYITGKGRCNVTNDCTPQEVLRNIPQNSRFLTSAITRFPPEQVKEFFQRQGVPLKTERGNRVFPQSDRAADIIDALLHALRRAGVSIVQDRAQGLRRTEKDGNAFGRCRRGTGLLSLPGGRGGHRRSVLSADRLHRGRLSDGTRAGSHGAPA